MNHSSDISAFSFVRYRLTLQASEELHLPRFKGSALRGVFGHTFRHILCPLFAETCQGCRLSKNCVYAYAFETIMPADIHPFLRKMSHAPHPFVIRPPADERTEYLPGDELVFELILIGQAVRYLPYFIYTFSETGRYGIGRGRGKFFLRRAESADAAGQTRLIFSSDSETLSDISEPITCADLLADTPIPQQCTFRFITPLRIREKGRYLDKIDFGVLFRNLLRRIAVLGVLHCNIDCSGIDFKGLCQAADRIGTVSSDLKWQYLQRYSNRQKDHTPLHGLVGEISFKGDFSPFWTYIRLGEYVHVGKNTGFGLGEYQCKV